VDWRNIFKVLTELSEPALASEVGIDSDERAAILRLFNHNEMCFGTHANKTMLQLYSAVRVPAGS
jgi:hypothetical protein